MRRTAMLGLAALAVASFFNVAPASAQQGGFRLYPWCALYNGGRGGGGTNCYSRIGGSASKQSAASAACVL